ncbi:MAG: adenylate/guanylate cyclase domain-containing protein [Acidobacteriota bacterium]
MASLRPFLPAHLERAIASGEAPARLPSAHRLEAALLFSDISGFTALTESLQARGKEGAEEVSDIIRASFRPAIEAINAFDGSILNFGGDALFVLFPGAGAVARAYGAAQRVADHFRDHGEVATSVGTARLRISQAIHHGRVAALHLGQPDRRQYLVCGAPVRALARLEARASGKLLLSRAARARFEDPVRAVPAGEIREALFSELAPYVAPHVRAAVDHFEGEFRRAAIVFFETRDLRCVLSSDSCSPSTTCSTATTGSWSAPISRARGPSGCARSGRR